MYVLAKENLTEIKDPSYSGLKIDEIDIAEIVRKNPDILSEGGEKLLIIGSKQDKGRTELTAIDNKGDLVLILINTNCSADPGESIETQAVRSASSYAAIESTDELVQRFFAPYVEQHISEFTDYSPRQAMGVLTDSIMQ